MIDLVNKPQLTKTNDLSKEIIRFKNNGIKEEELTRHLLDIFTVDLDLLEEVRRSNQ